MSKILKLPLLIAFAVIFLAGAGANADQSKPDVFRTSDGRLLIYFLGHASLRFEYHNKQIYIDPVYQKADLSELPQADIILFTHEHADHFDLQALMELKGEKTLVVLPEICAGKYGEGIIMKNEDVKIVQGIKIEGVPAYNIVNSTRVGFSLSS